MCKFAHDVAPDGDMRLLSRSPRRVSLEELSTWDELSPHDTGDTSEAIDREKKLCSLRCHGLVAYSPQSVQWRNQVAVPDLSHASPLPTSGVTSSRKIALAAQDRTS